MSNLEQEVLDKLAAQGLVITSPWEDVRVAVLGDDDFVANPHFMKAWKLRCAVLIDYFSDDYRYLSNFSVSRIRWAGKDWNTAEHVYQASKTLDESERERIWLSPCADKAKRLGRKVSLIKGWDDEREGIMRQIIYWKFIQNPHLGELLVTSGQAKLVEGNYWHDNYYGNCFCPECADKEGLNILGRLLMDMRQYLVDKDM